MRSAVAVCVGCHAEIGGPESCSRCGGLASGTRFCPFCGADGHLPLFCPYCGEPVAANASVQPAGVGLQIPPAWAGPPPKPNRWRSWVIGCGCLPGVLVVLAILAGAANGDLSTLLIATLAAVIPAVLYSRIILSLDRYEEEPTRAILFAFGWGAVAAVLLAIMGELIFASSLIPVAGAETADIATLVIGAPVIEEAFKGARAPASSLVLPRRNRWRSRWPGLWRIDRNRVRHDRKHPVFHSVLPGRRREWSRYDFRDTGADQRVWPLRCIPALSERR